MKGRSSHKNPKPQGKKLESKSRKKTSKKIEAKAKKLESKAIKFKSSTRELNSKKTKNAPVVPTKLKKTSKDKAVHSKKAATKPSTHSPKVTTQAKPKAPISKPKVTPPKARVNPNGMNELQQCVVLAAIVTQHRNKDPKFLFIPLADINSTALLPLREFLGNYSFTARDIEKSANEIQHSDKFKKCFPSDSTTKDVGLKITKNDMSSIMAELIELAGPEAKKIIYIIGENPHDIQKTTLEKHVLKLGLISPHPHLSEHQIRQDHDYAHKQTLMKLNLQKMGRGFSGNMQRLLGKQRRGRG